MAVDTSDPKIVSTYDAIRGGADTDWMILGLLPSLPGQSGHALGVASSGVNGLAELQVELSLGADGPQYAYMRHNEKLHIIEYIPDVLPSGVSKTVLNHIGKFINNTFKERDIELTLNSTQDLDSTLQRTLMSGSSTNVLGGKAFGQSTSSLSSDKDMDESGQEERVRQNMAETLKIKEEGVAKMRVLVEERIRYQAFFRERAAKEKAVKEAYKAQYQTLEEKNRKGPILSNWLDQLTPDGRFWRKRWLVVHVSHIHLYKDHTSLKPIMTIDMHKATVRDAREEWYLPDVMSVRDAAGSEYILRAEKREEYLRLVAAIERAPK
ncbi:hypothetical protein DFS34DRAFT_637935 [Phlyctochytrium arcticum]|nr:hypothetical protein DFS34DRAFT_637935 [Phlyctochytrium arcticum]